MRTTRERKASRTFGGKRYYALVFGVGKTRAKKLAREYREKGQRVRVIAHPEGWSVYVGPYTKKARKLRPWKPRKRGR